MSVVSASKYVCIQRRRVDPAPATRVNEKTVKLKSPLVWPHIILLSGLKMCHIDGADPDEAVKHGQDLYT